MDLNGSLLILLSIYLCFATKRKITINFPDTRCNATTTIPLLHIVATKENVKSDDIHYIVSTLERPTIAIKHVTKPSTITFNKTNICEQKGETFSFDRGGTSDLSGLVISKLYSYNDLNDEIEPHSGEHMDNDIMDNFHWKYVNSSPGGEVVFKGTSSAGSILTLTLHLHTEDGHGEEQPKNPINANLTEFRLEMSNLSTKYKHTRYAIEVVFFSTSRTQSSTEATHTTTQYIDDEYTPGIFEIWAVKFLPKLSEIKRTYVTWKPVSYNSPSWGRTDQGLVKKFLLMENGAIKGDPIPDPLPSYSRGVPWTLVDGMNPKYYAVNVSFGIPKDGFYNKNKYLSWSGMVGSGTPPVDSMSTRIILSMAIGLGLPGVVIVGGVVFLLLKRILYSTETSYDEIH